MGADSTSWITRNLGYDVKRRDNESVFSYFSTKCLSVFLVFSVETC